MSLSDQEFKEFIEAIDRSIAHFGGRPAEPGVDLALYEDLRKIREAMVRARRDYQDPNVTRHIPPASSS